MPRVVHFEISAKNPEKLIKFYEKVFGWKVVKCEDPVEYWLITTGEESEPGIDGGLERRTEQHQESLVINTINVSSVDEFSKKVAENGGTIVVAKRAVSGLGWLACFRDPEGTMFELLESDESAQ